jgi:hypothetical protein
MLEFLHELNLINDGFLTILFCVCSLLGKCFDGHWLWVFDSFGQINCCKIAFANFFFDGKQVMELPLIDFSPEYCPPLFYLLWIGFQFINDGNFDLFDFDKIEPNDFWNVVWTLWFRFVDDFIFDVKIKMEEFMRFFCFRLKILIISLLYRGE